MTRCVYCDEFQAVGPAGTCDHCAPMPDAPRDQRGPEPIGEPAPTIVYRITHLPTGRVYVGVHKLPPCWASPFLDDGYQGSSDYLAAAIDKHGWIEFRKDVLVVLPTEEAAYVLEAGLVGPEQVASPSYFNLCVGGIGGIGHLSEEAEARRRERLREVQQNEEWKAATAEACRRPERCAKLSASHRARYEDPAERELTKARSQRVWDSYSDEDRAARVKEIADRNREQARDAAWLAASSAGARRRYEDPAEIEKARARAREHWDRMTPDQRRALTSAASEAQGRADVRAKHSANARDQWERMTAAERSAENKRRAAATKLRRSALDALASSHGLADVVKELRAREKLARSVEMSRRYSVARENKRRKREVGVIFLALVAAAAS